MKTMSKMIFHKTTSGIDRWKSGKRRVRCEMPDLRDRSIREARESPRLLQPREATLHDAIARHHRFVTAYSTFGRTTAWLLDIAPKSDSHSAAQRNPHNTHHKAATFRDIPRLHETRPRETASQSPFLNIHCSAQNSPPNNDHPQYPSRGTRSAIERRPRDICA